MGTRQPWDNTPHKLTEFAPLSSEVKPSGGLFSRFLRRGKDESDNSDSSASSSRISSREASVDRGRMSAGDGIAGAAISNVDSSPVLTPDRTWIKNGDLLLPGVSTPQTYKDSDFKQYWMPDSSCRECYNCGDKFTTFRRRHHCRICGQIFCSKCCNQELPGKIIGYKGGIRVCQYCCKVVLRYAQQSESSGDVKIIREDLGMLSPIDSEVMLSQEYSLWSASKVPSVHEIQIPPQRSVSPQDPTNGVKTAPFDLTPMADISIQESLILTEDSAQLRMLWRQIQDSETGVEMQSHRIRLRTYLSCIVGKDLVTWLVDHDKVAKRDQAVGIGQALLFANYLEPVTNQRIFRDDFSLYKPGEQAISFVESQSDTEKESDTIEESSSMEPLWVREIKSIDRDEFDISFERQTNSTDSDHQKSMTSEISSYTTFYLGEKIESGSLPNEVVKLSAAPKDLMEEPLPRQDFSSTGLTDDFIKDALFVGKTPHAPDSICFPHAWRNIDKLREENGEKLAYSRLRQAHSELWDTLTKQLLSHNGLSMSWECVISSIIAQISRFVRPDIQVEGDEPDIRKYIHIKKIPGGQKTDTSLLHGVIFTKNVAHKKMHQQIANPQIMLLRGAIEYQRVENKFSSLEPQILQEREFLRNSVFKITAFRPSIVIVEKSVSRLAQEFLLDHGVTLVFNVKLCVMERLSRFTQADIVPSIDSLVSRPTLGFCHTFKCQSYLLPSGEMKTFVVFDGCATNLGCTISLRGGTSGELRKVKEILKFMSYTAYNSLLEISFCMDEFAMPIGTVDDGDPVTDFTAFKLEQEPEEKNQDIMVFMIDENKTLQSNKENIEKVDDDKLQQSNLANLDKNDAESLQQSKNQECLKKNLDAVDETLRLSKNQNLDAIDDEALQVSKNQNLDTIDDEILQVSKNQNLDAIDDEALQVSKNQNLDAIDDEILQVSKNQNLDAIDDEILQVSKNQNLDAVDDETLRLSKTPDNVDDSTCDETLRLSKTPDNVDDSTCDELKTNRKPICDIHAQSEDNKSHISVCDVDDSGIQEDFTSLSSVVPSINDQKTTLDISCHKHGGHIDQGQIILDTQEHKNGGHIDQGQITLDKQDPKNGCNIGEGQITLVSNKSFSEVNQDNVLTENGENKNLINTQGEIIGGRDDGSSPVLKDKKVIQTDSEIQGKPKSCDITELTDASDPLLNYQKTKDESIFESSSVRFQEHKQTKQHTFKRLISGVILSVCPYHRYKLPYLESKKGVACKLRKYLPEDLYSSPMFEGESQSSRTKYHDLDFTTRYSTKTNIQITEAHPFILCKLTEGFQENSTQGMLSDFRARGGRIKVLPSMNSKQNGIQRDSSPRRPYVMDGLNDKDKMKGSIMFDKKIDCLSPLNHQKISVLFSSYSHKSANHPNPCVNPWLVRMEFYGNNDITLGGFLERFCFRDTYLCPSESCVTPMVDHIRRFTHGTGCINVLLKKLDNEIAGGQNNILMWSWCCLCKQVTPVVPISADTWNLSFAKFLELRFNCNTFTRRAAAEPCNHSLHHDNNLYFGYRDIVASFRYCQIELQELALPSIVVDFHPIPVQGGRMKDIVKHIMNKGMEKFSAILECTMKLRNEIPSESSARAVSDFVTEQQCEKSKLRELAHDIQQIITDMVVEDSESDVLMRMLDVQDDIIRMKKMIVEAVFRWNSKIQDFLNCQQKKMKQPASVKKEKDKDMTVPSTDDTDRCSPRIDDKSRSSSDPQVIDNCDLSTTAVTSLLSQQSDKSIGSSGTTDTADDQLDGRSDKRTKRNIIASLWSGSSFVPVMSPFDPAEHYLLPPSDRLPVIIYDYEPSSVIAYALSSNEYHIRLREIQSWFGTSKKDNSGTLKTSSKGSDSQSGGAEPGIGTKRVGSGMLSFFRGTGSKEHSPCLPRKADYIDAVRYTIGSAAASLEDEVDSFSVFSAAPSSDSDKTKSSNKQSVTSHIELQFSDNVAKFYCRVFFAEQFRKLRKLIFPAGEDLFIRSLSRCKPWEAKGGKSGSTFCKTDDDRFILKQMSNMEIESFEKFGPEYFKYISKAYTEKKPTALAKILGVYRIGFRNTQTNNALKQDLLVMENLFYNRRIAQKYDLKGSLRNRLINTSGKRYEELVHLDENLLKLSVDSPLYIRPYSKVVLKSAINSDSDFLSTNLVMDYSLLVGLDESKKELVVGIIDYIRTFTWDKKLEMVVKSQISMIGGQGKMPTVVSPQLYRSRFLEAMDRYFLHVPDEWSGLGSDFYSQRDRKESKDDLESTLKS